MDLLHSASDRFRRNNAGVDRDVHREEYFGNEDRNVVTFGTNDPTKVMRFIPKPEKALEAKNKKKVLSSVNIDLTLQYIS